MGSAARHLGAATTLGPETQQIVQVVAVVSLRDQVRAFAQRCARDAASFIHPQLADIKHDHRTADGELIRPIIEITYPAALNEIAPPMPALALAKGKHLGRALREMVSKLSGSPQCYLLEVL
jgi:hypothetical protein